MTKDVLAALPAIYDAATSEDKWPEALDQLASATGSYGAILVAFDLVGQPFDVHTWSRVYKNEDIETYFSTFNHYEQHGIALLSSSPAHVFHRDTEVWPDPAVAQREDYVFLRERYGVLHRGGVSLSKGRSWNDSLFLQIDKQWADMPASFGENLAALLPHVAKVVEVNRTFTLLRLRHQAALAALDHVGIGMCIASESGEIIVANAEARRILGTGDGLGLARNGLLAAREENVTREIRAALELTALTAGGEAQRQEISIACPRQAAATPLLVEICPLRDSAGEVQRHLLGSLVCIIDPDATRDLSSEGLAKLFQFSPAEVAVCDGLLRGHTARDIADIRGVSPDTVRSQIKALYSKTGAANRVELIRLAISTNPPIA